MLLSKKTGFQNDFMLLSVQSEKGYQFPRSPKTAIDTKEFVQYEFYETNSTKGFSIHVYPPEEMVHWSIEISSATAAE